MYQMNDFDEYIRQDEPAKCKKGYTWQTVIGLQASDELLGKNKGDDNRASTEQVAEQPPEQVKILISAIARE